MHKLWTVLLATGMVGCVDYQFGRKNAPDDTGVQTLDTAEYPEEDCNGIDDNGNGLIDEGYPDFDADGVADCTDDSCEIAVPPGRSIYVIDDCGGGGKISDDPWDVAIEWQWTGVSANPSYRNVIVSPVIGNLTDDNGDGNIDTSDTPDVVFVAATDGLGLFGPSYLVVLDGATGIEHWASLGYRGYIQPSIVDVDGDGWPEILVSSAQGYDYEPLELTLLDYQGTEIWSEPVEGTYYPLVVDLEGDGEAEILFGGNIVDAMTGTVERTIGTTAPSFPAIGDINQDGSKELVFADGVWDAAGTKLWSHTPSTANHTYPVIVDTDGDPEGEVVMVTTGSFTVYDDDGTMLSVNHTDSANRVWPPCAADFDGDGDVELAWGDSSFFNVYELDGTLNWSTPTTDSSGAASCSAFDFNGDGRFEVLYADEDDLWVFDGQTGAILFNDPNHASGTLLEYPTVADVDGDGSAEMISPSSQMPPFLGKTGGTGGVMSYGHVDNEWAGAGPTWNAHDFSETNYNADSTVFGVKAPWQTYNLFQGRPPLAGLLSDLVVDITDVCVSACDPPGVVSVAVQVGNRGLREVENGLPVALYADNDGELTLIDEQVVPGGVPSGQAVEGIEFVFPWESYGTHGVVAKVGEDWVGLQECIEDNNSDAWTEQLCSQ